MRQTPMLDHVDKRKKKASMWWGVGVEVVESSARTSRNSSSVSTFPSPAGPGRRPGCILCNFFLGLNLDGSQALFASLAKLDFANPF